MISLVEDQEVTSVKGGDAMKSFDNNELRKRISGLGNTTVTGFNKEKTILPSVAEERGINKPRFTIGGVSAKDTKLLKDTVSKV